MLVTGAGGSIGAELCRQIARVGPARLDPRRPGRDAAVRHRARARRRARLLAPPSRCSRTCATARGSAMSSSGTGRPIVFHAAAYKHVPLMEANPIAAVANNALTTRTIASIAIEYGVERFVQISTDKAVNRQTVMGQCKLLCEWIVESLRASPRHLDPLRRGALRQRPELGGLRRADVPPPDREGRPGDGDASRDDALLHDDPRGRVARRAGRRDRRRRRCLRARHGRAGEDPRSRPQHDPALGQAAGQGDRDRVHRHAAGRDAVREALDRRRVRLADRAPEDPASEPAPGRRRRGSSISSPSSSVSPTRATRSRSSRSSARSCARRRSRRSATELTPSSEASRQTEAQSAPSA